MSPIKRGLSPKERSHGPPMEKDPLADEWHIVVIGSDPRSKPVLKRHFEDLGFTIRGFFPSVDALRFSTGALMREVKPPRRNQKPAKLIFIIIAPVPQKEGGRGTREDASMGAFAFIREKFGTRMPCIAVSSRPLEEGDRPWGDIFVQEGVEDPEKIRAGMRKLLPAPTADA